MRECSKSIQRRLSDSNFLRRYFVGDGIDIGGKPDPLMLYKEFFPLAKNIRTWDWDDGDAQYLKGVDEGTLDFIHSSHCLEHLVNPTEGLINWLNAIREGGHLIITVPEEDLYEQGQFPSTFNKDHKWTFTLHKSASWSEKSINICSLIQQLGPHAELIKAELLSGSYRFDLPRFDQSLSPVAECGIEFIIRKRFKEEVTAKGRLNAAAKQPPTELLLHLNQYKDDMRMMKLANQNTPPFGNSSPL